MSRLVPVLVILAAATAHAADRPAGVVANVRVISDKTPDVGSLDAWQASCIRPGMSDEQKALEVWKTVVRFQHQDSPPASSCTTATWCRIPSSSSTSTVTPSATWPPPTSRPSPAVSGWRPAAEPSRPTSSPR